MSTIARVGPSSGSGGGGRGPAQGGGGFSVPTADTGAVRGAAPAVAAPAVTLGGFLALQERDAEPARDREARRRGRALLAALAELQQALLGGDDQAAPLHRLAELARAAEPAADPDLQAVVQAVALRAQVELARRGL